MGELEAQVEPEPQPEPEQPVPVARQQCNARVLLLRDIAAMIAAADISLETFLPKHEPVQSGPLSPFERRHCLRLTAAARSRAP